MPNLQQRRAEELIERHCEAIAVVWSLRQHGTVWSNAELRAGIERIENAIVQANIRACLLWFPRDTHGDLQPPAA